MSKKPIGSFNAPLSLKAITGIRVSYTLKAQKQPLQHIVDKIAEENHLSPLFI